MAWFWPKIEDERSAETATNSAVAVSGFVAAVTALLSILSIIYRKPIGGVDGLGLIDAVVFAVIAWRIHKMSRAWAIVGILMYLFEVGYKLVTSPSGALGILTIVFILSYISAIRGTFAYHRYRPTGAVSQPPASPLG
jgi:hypothetical protein